MQKNKRKGRYLSLAKYILISLLVLVFALLLGAVISAVLSFSYNSAEPKEHIVGMLDGIIGAIAAGLVVFQLRSEEKTEMHQNDIAEASFILQYNQTFIQDDNMSEVEQLLENQAYYFTEEKEIITEENRQKFINYLVYLESLAPLVFEGILSLERIDDLMAYRFFLAIDNVELQEKEILPFADYYRGCFKLYKMWRSFRKENGRFIPCENCTNKKTMRELAEWEKFDQFAE